MLAASVTAIRRGARFLLRRRACGGVMPWLSPRLQQPASGAASRLLVAVLLWSMLLWSSLALAACGSRQFDGTVYRGQGFAFRIPTPPGHWRQLDHSDALAFRDDQHQATIMFNGRCGLDGEDVPLKALTNHLFIDFTDRQVESQETVPFDGREALHTRLLAKYDGVPMRYDAWVLKKDGCVYDMLYLAQPERFEGGYRAFEQVVRNFATLDPEA